MGRTTPKRKSSSDEPTPAPTRLELLEVVSFRLKAPLADLRRLPERLAPVLSLFVEQDRGELTVACEDQESYLRFRSIGEAAVLTEVFVSKDEGAVFFAHVLGALMLAHQGDLVAKATWSSAERNAAAAWAEVHIHRGETTFPGFALKGAPDEEPETLELDARVQEVESLLEEARRLYAAYQRSKSKG